MDETNSKSFAEFIVTIRSLGGLTTDDVIASFLPLAKAVLTMHESQKTLNFKTIKDIVVVDDVLTAKNSEPRDSVKNYKKLEGLKIPHSNAFEVIGEEEITTDLATSQIDLQDLHIQTDPNAEILKPLFLPSYQSYEISLGHHDELTDIFILGMLLASVALAMDLSTVDDLQTFVRYRTRPIMLNRSIHPVLANLITEMTELDRRKRTADLYSIIEKLQNYRSFDASLELELTATEGYNLQDLSTASNQLLAKLKRRLFDTSRRNKLLYFSNSMKFLNLTVSSVPNVLNYESINPSSLFTWNDDIAGAVTSGKPIALSKYLRFEENQYISPTLDKIKSESLKDRNEYGFNQLRLVIAFIKWYNLKEAKHEQINSPLLLIPVDLKKKKGVKDQYIIDVLATQAEVNPLLVHMFKELYDINLPTSITLEEVTLKQFYENLKQQIESTKSGITIQYSDKPKLKIIFSQAKQAITKFQKRIRKSVGESLSSLAHNYSSEDFSPLGLTLFKRKIKRKYSVLEFLINEDLQGAMNTFSGDEKKGRSLFSLVDGADSNPYLWEFDTCNITLGNFNYRKMSLVRDFDQIIDAKVSNPVFEKLFSNAPRDVWDYSVDADDIRDQYSVIPADPTQTKSIAYAKNAQSYIIQGPPGTGKSQTITNLVADFVARGKKVLFVCEKRAAIDVVYYRLKQQKLDEICARIHDSQTDKKEFIMNLKSTYEDFIKNAADLEQISKERDTYIEIIETELAVIRRFNTSMKKVEDGIGISLVKLINRLIELKQSHVELDDLQLELMPEYHLWIQFGQLIHELAKTLKEIGYDASLANNPVSKISQELLQRENPVNEIYDLLSRVEQLITNLIAIYNENELPAEFTKSYRDLAIFINNTYSVSFLAERGILYLLDEADARSIEFEKSVYELIQLENKYQAQLEQNVNWKNKFSPADLKTALTILKDDKGLLAMFNSKLTNLKKSIDSAYDFGKHAIRPEYIDVLQNLASEYEVAEELAAFKKKVDFVYKTDDLHRVKAIIAETKNKQNTKDSRDDIDYILHNLQNKNLILAVAASKTEFDNLKLLLDELLGDYDTNSLSELKQIIANLRSAISSIPDLLPSLSEIFNKAPKNLAQVVRKVAFTPEQMENAFAVKSLNRLYRTDKQLSLIEGSTLDQRLERIKKAYEKLFELNSKFIRAKIRRSFIENINISAQSEQVLPAEKRNFKRMYAEGRKILENEFHKAMRFKSIRELASRESGKVMLDIKPVWLMSPLSVSDTLPIDANFFDVVIFDEASQITLEEGIPPLFRSSQAIIVGDEMQMPPTNFFAAKVEEVESEDAVSEEEITIDAESLLTQGGRKLASVMLGWHYRSRYESLISFSNSAFYNKNLLTIPDKSVSKNQLDEIVISEVTNETVRADAFKDRSISFHHLEHGIYASRANQSEADYIALLVRKLLRTGTKQSIGIVAFSQEQQTVIEDALSRLARSDEEFATMLEEEFTRTENDQFVGLFVKNLENIQGDERDIIIISICYGYDDRGKMFMNFGPINRRGGEKRLNVIFSRAKQHMAVISSIHHFDIKNEYNEGANYFRKFLQYAELVSKGNVEGARLVIDSMSIGNAAIANFDKNIVQSEIAKELTQQGYLVNTNVGQSYFRCNIGVVDPQNLENYLLGILIDTDAHYQNDSLMEQYFLRKSILKSFGWNVIQVYTKDWYHNPQKVLDRIKKKLDGIEEQFAELVVEPIVAAPVLKTVVEIKTAEPEAHREGLVESVAVVEAAVEEPKTPVQKVIEPVAESVEAEVAAQQVVKPVPVVEAPPAPKVETTPPSSAASQDDPSNLAYDRYEYVEGVHSKFWEIAPAGNKVYVRYGRIGTAGQINLKVFSSDTEALQHIAKVKAEKVKKGYIQK
jgi:superfamily I DNA and/or RNA helicase/predicted DNA-binding WGR domain protein